MTQLRVILGAGTTGQPGWISTREEELNLLDPADFARMFAPASVDAFLAEHVWEHMTEEEGCVAAANCYAWLKPGGYLRCAVPDAYFRNHEYQKMVQVGGPGPADHPAASHKIVYSYRTLTRVFERAGFDVTLLEYCDERGDFRFHWWDPEDGKIGRSLRFDTRNTETTVGMVSIILDAKKPLLNLSTR